MVVNKKQGSSLEIPVYLLGKYTVVIHPLLISSLSGMSYPSMNILPLDVLNHHFPAAPIASVRITRLLYYTADPLSITASVMTIIITD